MHDDLRCCKESICHSYEKKERKKEKKDFLNFFFSATMSLSEIVDSSLACSQVYKRYSNLGLPQACGTPRCEFYGTYQPTSLTSLSLDNH